MNTARKISNRIRKYLPFGQRGEITEELFHIETVESLFALLEACKKYSKNRIVFRGLSSVDYFPISSLERGNKLGEEDLVVSENEEIFNTCIEPFDKWAVLQHLGGPTRFLDFTYNYIVAMYFAVANVKDIDKDGYILIGETSSRLLNYQRNYANFISKLPIIARNDEIGFHYSKIDGLHTAFGANEHIFSTVMNRELIGTALKRYNISTDYLKNNYSNVVFVEPSNYLRRQLIQETVMLLHHNYLLVEYNGRSKQLNEVKRKPDINEIIFTLDYKRYEPDFFYKNFVVVQIHKDCKKEIKEALEYVGLTEELLFPKEDIKNKF